MFGGSVQSATCILWVIVLVVGNMKIWVKERVVCRSGFSANHRCARRKGGKIVLRERELTVQKIYIFLDFTGRMSGNNIERFCDFK